MRNLMQRFQPPAGDLALPVAVLSAGREQRRRDYDWHGRRRGSSRVALLQFTTAGRGHLTYEGEERTLTAGDLMLVHWPHDHRYRVEPGERWDFVYLTLVGPLTLRVWPLLAQRTRGCLATDAALGEYVHAHCVDLLATPEDRPLRASALAYQLIVALVERLLDDERSAADPAIDRAQTFARAHLTAAIGVADLAAAAGMSAAHFSRRYKRMTGMAPGAWLIDQRLEHAAALLVADERPLQEVAAASGFTSANYFIKAFRRRYGITPGAYRDLGR